MGFANVLLQEALIEPLARDDESVGVAISNGVIALVTDKDAVVDEIGSTIRATKPHR